MLEKEEEEEKDEGVEEEEDSGDGDLCRSLGTTTSKLHDEAAPPPLPLKAAPNSRSRRSLHWCGNSISCPQHSRLIRKSSTTVGSFCGYRKGAG